jgi:uncharacterized membrane protein
MGTLAQAKTYGGVGSILLVLSAVPLVLSAVPLAGFVLGIVGFILVLIAVKYLSENLGDRSIFVNALYFVIIGLIGFLIAFFLAFAALFPFLGPGFSPTTGPIDPTDPGAILAATTVLIGLVIGWILFIVAAVFLRRSFNSISARLGVRMFGTAALLYFIGAILLIVVVGGVLIYIAEILMIVAFFSIPEQQPPAEVAQPPSA